MDDMLAFGYPKAEEVAQVVDRIAKMFAPHRIYLYSHKFTPGGTTTSFKLCVVADFPDKAAAEKNIYLQIDCPVPFDVILYTVEEWRELCDRRDSFARKIFLTGTVVHG